MNNHEFQENLSTGHYEDQLLVALVGLCHSLERDNREIDEWYDRNFFTADFDDGLSDGLKQASNNAKIKECGDLHLKLALQVASSQKPPTTS